MEYLVSYFLFVDKNALVKNIFHVLCEMSTVGTVKTTKQYLTRNVYGWNSFPAAAGSLARIDWKPRGRWDRAGPAAGGVAVMPYNHNNDRHNAGGLQPVPCHCIQSDGLQPVPCYWI